MGRRKRKQAENRVRNKNKDFVDKEYKELS
jgi:hypothetical protein